MLSPKTALALLLLTSMASAGDFHGRHAMAGQMLASHARLAIRQEDDTPDSGAGTVQAQTSAPPADTSAPPAPPTTSASPPPQTSDEPSPEPTTPPAPETSDKPPADPTTPPPTTALTAEPSKPTAGPPKETSEEEQKTSTKQETSKAPLPTTPPVDKSSSIKAQPTTLFGTQEYTTIVITRNPQGQEETATRTEKTLVPTATAEPIDSAPKTETGMSKQTKTTVIGVVCGVGGAIILAAAFFLWWKWSSRRKQRAAIDDGDELVGMNAFQPSGMGSTSEKHGAMAGGGQGGLFKDNLESYHAPASQRPANAGTNF